MRVEVELVDGGVGNGSLAPTGIYYQARTRIDELGGALYAHRRLRIAIINKVMNY